MFLTAGRQKSNSAGRKSCSGNPPPQTGADINAPVQSLADGNRKLTNEVTGLKFECTVLQEKYDLSAYKRFARSPGQENSNNTRQSLFDEDAAKTDAGTESPEETEKETVTRTRKKNAGREPIPAEIPGEAEYIDLSEEEKRCSRCCLQRMLLETLKPGPVIRTGETTVRVTGEEDRKDTQKSYMWLARGGPPDKSETQFPRNHMQVSSVPRLGTYQRVYRGVYRVPANGRICRI
jgi:hypothetical protein